MRDRLGQTPHRGFQPSTLVALLAKAADVQGYREPLESSELPFGVAGGCVTTPLPCVLLPGLPSGSSELPFAPHRFRRSCQKRGTAAGEVFPGLVGCAIGRKARV
jgi:hypothetical protein